MTTLRRMWAAAPVATALLGLAIAAGLFFAVRLAGFWLYWADPAHRDQTIAGWMTPRYVSMSWDVPREAMTAILALEPREGRPPNLDDIARERGIPLAQLIGEIEAGIAAWRAAQAPQR